MNEHEKPFEPTTEDVAAIEAQQKLHEQLSNPKSEHISEACHLIVKAFNTVGAPTFLDIVAQFLTNAQQTIGQSTLQMADDVDPRDQQLTIVKSNLFGHASNAVRSASLMLEGMVIVFAEPTTKHEIAEPHFEGEIPHIDFPATDPSNN
jgi:hypothetical protein